MHDNWQGTVSRYKEVLVCQLDDAAIFIIIKTNIKQDPDFTKEYFICSCQHDIDLHTEQTREKQLDCYAWHSSIHSSGTNKNDKKI